jgi:hypothetical protein
MSLTIPSAQYTGLSTDAKPNTNIFDGATYYEKDTFILYYWTGSKWKTWEQLHKEGRWIAVSSTGGTGGIFQNNISGNALSFVRSFNATYGLTQVITTHETINSYAGIRSTVGYAERAINPYLRVVFRLSEITDCRFFCGWSSYFTTVGNNSVGATIYDTHNAIGLKLETDATNFELYHNDGSSPGTTEVTPVAPADDQIHTFELRALNSVPKYQFKFDNATTWSDITTDIPLEATEMAFQAWLENTVASSKVWRLIDVYTRIDNKG